MPKEPRSDETVLQRSEKNGYEQDRRFAWMERIRHSRTWSSKYCGGTEDSSALLALHNKYQKR
jgi:hypothetical protein